jgi:RES domain-containing protein
LTKVFRLFRPGREPGDAAGAYKWGGRWNNPGTAILYTASSLALACLEILVHIRDVNVVPGLVYSLVAIPDQWIEPLEGSDAWKQARLESRVLSREVGDRWIRERRDHRKPIGSQYHPRLGSVRQDRPQDRSPVLQVPSIVIPQESNYLLDPEDIEIKKLAWSTPKPFRFDPRLLDPNLRENL